MKIFIAVVLVLLSVGVSAKGYALNGEHFTVTKTGEISCKTPCWVTYVRSSNILVEGQPDKPSLHVYKICKYSKAKKAQKVLGLDTPTCDRLGNGKRENHFSLRSFGRIEQLGDKVQGMDG